MLKTLNSKILSILFQTFSIFFMTLMSFSLIKGQDIKIHNPESAGMSTERLARIHPFIQEFIDQERLAGASTLVARKGKIIHFETFGNADISSSKPIEKNSIFRIYSMTKPIATTAIMMLYEEGEFQLSDPVSKYIPEISSMQVYNQETEQLEPQKTNMRIVDVLRHTTGFGYGWGNGDMVDTAYAKSGIFLAKDLEDFFDRLKEVPLYFQPGTAWRYGVSTDIAGLLIERISGQSLRAFLMKRIFEPLEMHDTDFYVPSHKVERLVTNYGLNDDGSLKVIDHPSNSNFAKEHTMYSGGGGLLSTSADYLRFCQMILNGGELNGKRILGRKTIELMSQNHTTKQKYHGGPVIYPNEVSGFGLGFSVDVAPHLGGLLGSPGVIGWSGMAGTYFRIDPDEDLIYILMIQIIPNHQLEIRDKFRNLVYQAVVD